MESPVEVLEKVLTQMTPDNWESYGWGDAAGVSNEGSACLLHQVAIAAGIDDGLHREDEVKRVLRKTTRYIMSAIRRRFGGKRGPQPTHMIESFNDAEVTSYEDARIVVKDALARAKAENG